MSRSSRIPLLVLSAALAVALVAGLGQPQPSTAVTGPATVRVVTRQLESARIDLGRAGQSAGDVELASSLVYNTRVTPKSIGQYELKCTFVRRASRICQGTLHLPKGDIVVGGGLEHWPLYELGVLGGTGLYDNARGTLTATRLDTQPTRELLLVRLLG